MRGLRAHYHLLVGLTLRALAWGWDTWLGIAGTLLLLPLVPCSSGVLSAFPHCEEPGAAACFCPAALLQSSGDMGCARSCGWPRLVASCSLAQGTSVSWCAWPGWGKMQLRFTAVNASTGAELGGRGSLCCLLFLFLLLLSPSPPGAARTLELQCNGGTAWQGARARHGMAACVGSGAGGSAKHPPLGFQVCVAFAPLHPALALCTGWESPTWCMFGDAALWGPRGVITSIHPQPDQDEDLPTDCTEPDSEGQPGWEGAPVTSTAPEEPCRLVLSTPSSILQEREIEEVRGPRTPRTGPA